MNGDEKSEPQAVNIEQTKAEQYGTLERRYEMRQTAIEQPDIRQETLPDWGKDALEILSEKRQREVMQFVNQMLRFVSDEELAEAQPTSKTHLLALVTAGYQRAVQEAGKEGLPEGSTEMYVRATAPLRATGTTFRLEKIDSDQILSTYFGVAGSAEELIELDKAAETTSPAEATPQKPHTRVETAAALAGLITATMPVTRENEGAFENFIKKIRPEVEAQTTILADAVAKEYVGDVSRADVIASYPIIYVSDMTRISSLSNDPVFEEQRVYHEIRASGLNEKADEITDIPTIIQKLPFGYKTPTPELITTAIKVNVHERVHEAAKIEPESLGLVLINEMLTDTQAYLIKARRENVPFVDVDRRPKGHGYSYLVELSADLVKMKIVSEIYLEHFALRQDPDGFMNYLEAQIAIAPDRAEKVYTTLMKHHLILPKKSADRKAEVEKLTRSPREYILAEITKAAELMGDHYFGIDFYISAMYDRLMKDTDYVTAQLQRYRELDLPLPPDIIAVLVDPETGIFPDNAIDTFYDFFKYARNFIPQEALAVYAKDNSVFEGIDATPEQRLEIMNLNNILVTQNSVVRTAEKYEDDKDVMTFGPRLYKTVKAVLSENANANVPLTHEAILKLCQTITKEWHEDNRVKISELLERAEQNVRALQSPVKSINADGKVGEHVPTVEQINMYARGASRITFVHTAMDEDTSDVNPDLIIENKS